LIYRKIEKEKNLKEFFMIRILGIVILFFMIFGCTINPIQKDTNTTNLPKILNIEWNLNKDLPQGLQDIGVGLINNNIVYEGGFCSGLNNDVKPKYPRGYISKTWLYDTTIDEYTALPDFPGSARQATISITVNNEIYLWGGYNYDFPYCYMDGWKFDGINYIKLPDLPCPLAYAGICSKDNIVYIFGGCQYTGSSFINDESGNTLMSIDTSNLNKGWTIIKDCPPTKRSQFSMNIINNDIYIIGGGYLTDAYYNIIDNWRYNIISKTWSKISDLPISCSCFSNGISVFKNRYIILVGGYQWDYIYYNNEFLEKCGIATKHNNTGDYYNDLYIYDSLTNTFGRTTGLPINNATPNTILIDNKIYIIGGECDPTYINGIFYGHHPDLNLIGIITE
jgi:N-acetylneuraminic acid mutarotase